MRGYTALVANEGDGEPEALQDVPLRVVVREGACAAVDLDGCEFASGGGQDPERTKARAEFL